MKSYVVDSLTYAIESGTLRRWEVWVLRRIRERMISDAMENRA
jgi:hypothetical protein